MSGILGGAGIYAIAGARLLLSPAEAKQVGGLVHMGHDFPKDIFTEIQAWGAHIKYVETPERPTTRAKNTYSGELRNFEFLTPKLQVDHTILDFELLQSQAFHIIGTPERCIDVVNGILIKRQKLPGTRENPCFVWEPMEHSCSPQNLPIFIKAMRLVNIFSPNEDEFAKLLDVEYRPAQAIPGNVLKSKCDKLRRDGELEAVVVRLGANGAYVAQSARHRHLPAYHKPYGAVTRVIDVTGGGNAFLGGYCLGMIQKPLRPDLTQYESAAVSGAIAASFAIEQIGMPKLSCGADGAELWNGEHVKERIHTYLDSILAATYDPSAT